MSARVQVFASRRNRRMRTLFTPLGSHLASSSVTMSLRTELVGERQQDCLQCSPPLLPVSREPRSSSTADSSPCTTHSGMAVSNFCEPTSACEFFPRPRLMARKHACTIVRTRASMVWASISQLFSQFEVEVRNLLRYRRATPRTQRAGLAKRFHDSILPLIPSGPRLYRQPHVHATNRTASNAGW